MTKNAGGHQWYRIQRETFCHEVCTSECKWFDEHGITIIEKSLTLQLKSTLTISIRFLQNILNLKRQIIQTKITSQ